jgi:hypothetical protein
VESWTSHFASQNHTRIPPTPGLINIYVLGYFQVFMPINICITCEQGQVSTVANAKTEEMGTSYTVIENTNSFPHIYVHVNTCRGPQMLTDIQICKDRLSHQYGGTNVCTTAQKQEKEARVMKIVVVLRTGQT